jgi:hypothetical protein
VAKANLQFELVVVALNTPPQFGGVDKLRERNVRKLSIEALLARFLGLACFDDRSVEPRVPHFQVAFTDEPSLPRVVRPGPLSSGRRRLDAVPPRIPAGRSLGLRDEAVVKDIMATINGGDVSALPPIHLWRPLTPWLPVRPGARARRLGSL